MNAVCTEFVAAGEDAGRRDAGNFDAGRSDAGQGSGSDDSGIANNESGDGGDAGATDGGVSDAGSQDGGDGSDAGLDAGRVSYCPSGWCWESPEPHGNRIRAMAVNTPSDFWTGAEAGIVAHWAGIVGRWDVVETAPVGNVTGLWLGQSGRLYAVGRSGNFAVRELDGTWSVKGGSPGRDLNGIWGSDEGHVWATGDQGAVFFWNGSSLVKQQTPNQVYMLAIGGSSATDVWAVGEFGTAFHFNGSNWSLIPTAPLFATTRLLSISVVSPSDVWIGGSGEVLHWNGSTMATLSAPPGSDNGKSDIYALQYDGTNVIALNGWEGQAFRLSGSSWVQETWEGDMHFALANCGSGCLLAGGYEGRVSIRQNNTWSGHSGPHEWSYYGVHGSGPNDVWAVGVSYFRHYDGVRWARVNGVDDGTARGVYVQSPSAAWVVTTRGGIGAWNGSNWMLARQISLPDGGRPSLNAVHGVGAAAWLVGTSGVVMRYDGGWVPHSSPTSEDLQAVFVSGPEDVWVGGASNVLSHWSQGTWTNVASAMPAGATISDIEVEPNGRVTVVATGPGRYECQVSEKASMSTTFSLLVHQTDDWCKSVASIGGRRFVGTSSGVGELTTSLFAPIQLFADGSLGMWAAGDNDIWVVGAGAAILHHRP